MARIPARERLPSVLAAATKVFIRKGYQRAQMDDVARELGVGKGTLYRVVESKEALFHAALVHASPGKDLGTAATFPLAAPKPGATVAYVARRIAEASAEMKLATALDKPTGETPRDELRSIVLDLYRVMSTHRTALKLIDRCAAEYPGLADAWFGGARSAQVDLLARYLEHRGRAGMLATVRAPGVAARMIVEAIAFWAIHRHWDPAPRAVDEVDVEATLVEIIVGALGKGPAA